VSSGCVATYFFQIDNLLISKQRRCPEAYTIKKGVYSFCKLLLTRFYVEQRSEYTENKEGRQKVLQSKTHILTNLNTKLPPRPNIYKKTALTSEVLFYETAYFIIFIEHDNF